MPHVRKAGGGLVPWAKQLTGVLHRETEWCFPAGYKQQTQKQAASKNHPDSSALKYFNGV